MKVLLTGAFGNVGIPVSPVFSLKGDGYDDFDNDLAQRAEYGSLTAVGAWLAGARQRAEAHE